MGSGDDGIWWGGETQGAGNFSAWSLQATPEVPQERRLWKESQETGREEESCKNLKNLRSLLSVP